MKKVALLMQSSANGGVQRIMINLAKGMLEQGAEVDFLIADATGEMNSQIPKECLVYDFRRRNARGDLKVFLSIMNISKYMRCNPNTVIYAAPGLACTVVAFLKIFHHNSKVVLINDNKCSLLRKSGLYHKAVYYSNKIVYRFADEVVAAHMPAMLDIAEQYHIKSEKIHVIYHPLIDRNIVDAAEPEREHPFIRAKTEGYKLLIAVGRLVEEKAFDNLIEAVAIVSQKEKVKLIVLGDGPQRTILTSKIKDKKLEDDIDLFGYTENVFSFMKSADLYVLSSRQEAFGNVLVEAIACGLPCVATDCISGGPKEILEQNGPGKYGVLCERENITALADAILVALNRKYQKEDFELKTSDFEINNSAKKYLEYAEELGK